MDKKKQQLIITGILLIVMVILFARTLFPAKKGAARPAGSASSFAISTETMAANMTFLSMLRQNESTRLLQEAYWEKPWGRDPFALSRSSGAVEEVVSEFTLSGIVWDESMPVAIINQKLMKTGDSVGSCQVKEIRRNSVSIACSDRTFDLQLFKPQNSAGDKQAKS